MNLTHKNRNQAIDFLRGVAVALTIFRHFGVNLFLYKIGWVGVDLFFVLSGFLVSGLLFGEYKKTGGIDFPRFFVRRGLKIYPLFYLIILVYLIQVKLDPVLKVDFGQIKAEALFYKNYVGGNPFWIHTWSIDIEEHFYLFLPLLLITLVFLNKSGKTPFSAIPYIFVIIALTCLSLRIYTTLTRPFEHHTNVSPTHLRIDSLFFGTFLSYFYHFHRERLFGFVQKNKAFLRIASLIFLLPCAIFWDNDPNMTTWGFSSLYLGFGGIIILSIFSDENFPAPIKRIYSATASMGFYSYAIYIIHWPVYWWFVLPHSDYLDANYPVKLAAFFVYFAATIFIGIILSKTIEIPFLSLRDKLFPSKSKAF